MSDLNMAEGGGLGDLPRNYSFGDLPPLETASNGGLEPSPASGSAEKGGRAGTPTSPASLLLNRPQGSKDAGVCLIIPTSQPGAGLSPP